MRHADDARLRCAAAADAAVWHAAMLLLFRLRLMLRSRCRHLRGAA